MCGNGIKSANTFAASNNFPDINLISFLLSKKANALYSKDH